MNFTADYENFDREYPIRSLTVNNLNFHCRLGGTGEKTIVLLVGGFGISDIFCNHFTTLAQTYTVITFDYPVETNRNTELSDGIAALLQAMGRTRVILLGQSYGGLLAQVIAGRHPEMIEGMILSNTGCLDANMSPEVRNAMFTMLGKLKKGLTLTKVIPTPLLRKIVLKNITSSYEPCGPDEKQYLDDLWKFMMSRLTAKHERHMCSLMIDLGNETEITKERLRYLGGRTLLILSPDDHTFGDAVNLALIDLMPGPVVNREISGGHLALLVKPDLYLHTVRQFIDSHRAHRNE